MASSRSETVGRSGLVWAGIAFVALTALVHLIEAPEYFEAAAYLGVLFILNFAGGVASAYGIYRDKGWGWTLGLIITVGAFVAYIVSRTVGLPGLTETEFFEPSGVISLVVEAAFVIVAVLRLQRR